MRRKTSVDGLQGGRKNLGDARGEVVIGKKKKLLRNDDNEDDDNRFDTDISNVENTCKLQR